MNEGAILAAREGRKSVSQYDFIRSIEKVMLGPERKSHILSQEEKRVTAYHEVGHALVASVACTLPAVNRHNRKLSMVPKASSPRSARC